MDFMSTNTIVKLFYSTLVVVFLIACRSSNKQIENEEDVSKTMSDSTTYQILHHGDCSYILSEPKGWVANPNPYQQNELIRMLVMYEPSTEIKHIEPTGIYSNVIFKNQYKDTTFNAFLKGDVESAIERGEKVIDAPSIETLDNKKAIIKNYFYEQVNEYFAIAYIDEPKYIIMITYTSKNLNDFHDNYKSFVELVKTYRYWGWVVLDESNSLK